MRTMRLKAVGSILGALILPLASCVDARDPAPDASAEPTQLQPAGEDPTYSSTAVHLNPDGTQTVTYSTVRLSEEIRMREAQTKTLSEPSNQSSSGRQQAGTDLGKAADAISQDSSCVGADIWIYDQTNLTGNRICFYGAGVADLASYTYACQPAPPPLYLLCYGWDTAVKSYWGGTETGWWQYDGSNLGTCTFESVNSCAFAANSMHNSLSTCESYHHRYLDLEKQCNYPTSAVGENSDPVSGSGTQFYPSGSVRAQIVNGSTVKYTYYPNADSSGAVFVGLGNPSCYGISCGCGDKLVLTDQTSGYSATATFYKSCF